jgi:hypothetical protein
MRKGVLSDQHSQSSKLCRNVKRNEENEWVCGKPAAGKLGAQQI